MCRVLEMQMVEEERDQDHHDRRILTHGVDHAQDHDRLILIRILDQKALTLKIRKRQ